MLLITDADAPVASRRRAVGSLADPVRAAQNTATACVVLIATSARPDQLDARLFPELCDRELGLRLFDAANSQIAAGGAAGIRFLPETSTSTKCLPHTGFRRPGCAGSRGGAAGSVRSQCRRPTTDAAPRRPPGALTVIRPLSRSASDEVTVGDVTLDDVGDMASRPNKH